MENLFSYSFNSGALIQELYSGALFRSFDQEIESGDLIRSFDPATNLAASLFISIRDTP